MEHTVNHWRNVMKNRILAILGLVLLAAASASAQTIQPSQIKVPFAFQVGSAHFAPGTYTIATVNNLTLNLRGAQGAAFASMKPESNGKAVASSKVVFRRVGGQYFLAQVWTAGSTDHLTAYPTKAEKQALKTELAANQPTAPAVEIALAR